MSTMEKSPKGSVEPSPTMAPTIPEYDEKRGYTDIDIDGAGVARPQEDDLEAGSAPLGKVTAKMSDYFTLLASGFALVSDGYQVSRLRESGPGTDRREQFVDCIQRGVRE